MGRWRGRWYWMWRVSRKTRTSGRRMMTLHRGKRKHSICSFRSYLKQKEHLNTQHRTRNMLEHAWEFQVARYDESNCSKSEFGERFYSILIFFSYFSTTRHWGSTQRTKLSRWRFDPSKVHWHGKPANWSLRVVHWQSADRGANRGWIIDGERRATCIEWRTTPMPSIQWGWRFNSRFIVKCWM